jgi:hypothetical protein
MAVRWSEIEPYVQRAFEAAGTVERADLVDLAYADNASDDVVDALDVIGSRVFNSVDAAKQFLVGQGAARE